MYAGAARAMACATIAGVTSTTAEGATRSRARRVVFVSLATAIPQAVALGVAAAVTSSSALLSQTFVKPLSQTAPPSAG